MVLITLFFVSSQYFELVLFIYLQLRVQYGVSQNLYKIKHLNHSSEVCKQSQSSLSSIILAQTSHSHSLTVS